MPRSFARLALFVAVAAVPAGASAQPFGRPGRGGKPTVAAEPDGQIAMVYQELARQVGARIVLQEAGAQAMPTITVSDD